jgi:hypothetical protein
MRRLLPPSRRRTPNFDGRVPSKAVLIASVIIGAGLGMFAAVLVMT